MTQKHKQVSLHLSYEDYFNMTSRTGTQNTWNFNPLSQNTWNFNPLSQNKFHKLHTPARLHYKYPKKILELPHESYKFWCPNFKVPGEISNNSNNYISSNMRINKYNSLRTYFDHYAGVLVKISANHRKHKPDYVRDKFVVEETKIEMLKACAHAFLRLEKVCATCFDRFPFTTDSIDMDRAFVAFNLINSLSKKLNLKDNLQELVDTWNVNRDLFPNLLEYYATWDLSICCFLLLSSQTINLTKTYYWLCLIFLFNSFLQIRVVVLIFSKFFFKYCMDDNNKIINFIKKILTFEYG
jgi:hypothetical protein